MRDDDDDLLYNDALVPGRFGFLDLEPSPNRSWRALGHYGQDQLLLLADKDRGRHMYVCGTTGAGKTRFLASLIMQDIHFGTPVCVLDAAGQLYDYARYYVARCRESLTRNKAGMSEQDLARVMGRFHFLDITDNANPLRVNPFLAQSGDTTETVIHDFMRTIERETSDWKTQRVIYTVLGAAVRMAVELNQLPVRDRPPLPDGLTYKVGLRFVSKLLRMDNKERTALVERIPWSLANEEARDYWLVDFPRLPPARRSDEIGSSQRILGFFHNEVGRRFFETDHNTLDIYSLVADRHSLFCRLPQTLSRETISLIGTYLANKVQQVAWRRREKRAPGWDDPYTLMLDEFQLFCDKDLAEAFALSRNYGLRLVCAHQTFAQEPFGHPTGKEMLHTVVGMSRVKVVLQVDARTADQLVDEVLPISHGVAKRTEREDRDTVSESHTDGRGTSEEQSYSDQESVTFGRSDAQSFTYPFAGVIHDRSSKGSTSQYSTHSGRSSQRSQGTNRTSTEGSSRSQTHIERVVYCSGEEERVLNRQALQTLEVGEALVSSKPLSGVKVEVPFLPDPEVLCLPGLGFNRADRLLVEQRRRVGLELPALPAAGGEQGGKGRLEPPAPQVGEPPSPAYGEEAGEEEVKKQEEKEDEWFGP